MVEDNNFELRKENFTLKQKNQRLEKKNAEAEELLTRFVMASVYFNGKEADLVKEAEQFLKETEQ